MLPTTGFAKLNSARNLKLRARRFFTPRLQLARPAKLIGRHAIHASATVGKFANRLCSLFNPALSKELLGYSTR
jgi:hypothetical protein